MTDYFQEMGWEALPDGQAPLVDIARFLRHYNIFDETLQQNLPPPASKTSVEALPDVDIENKDSQCPVCLKKYHEGATEGTIKQMPCKHNFHSECIIPWLSKTNSCPLCRHELPTDDENYEALKKEKVRAKQRELEIEILHDSMFS